ncbi:MAG TPA: ABC transporter permease [Kofleriaceae bacterium]|nr:ABC transporter permease [Kofleriaceae bacterium]
MTEPGPPPAAEPSPAAPPQAPPPGAPSPPPGQPPGDGPTVGAAIATGARDAVAPLTRLVDRIGDHVILFVRALSWLPRRPFRPNNYLEACEYIGFGSLPIVLLVGAFTGMVMSLQSVYAFRAFQLESFAGGTTGKALAVELAPVLTALMVSGRAGAGIATELGTMRISEQIDALESMAVNPIQFLVLPRVVAGALMGPILTLLFFVIGMIGAYFVAVIGEGVDHGQWVLHTRDILEPLDVVQGLLKSIVFGALVVLIGCYQGYNATGGGRGVGLGTTRAVVIGSVMVLVTDYFLARILLGVLEPAGGAA